VASDLQHGSTKKIEFPGPLASGSGSVRHREHTTGRPGIISTWLWREHGCVMADEFWEKYKDPRWQRVRLTVMNREQFTCEKCKRKDVTLNVHHGYYERGRDPWDYPTASLHCYCENCHELVHSKLSTIKLSLSFLPDAYFDEINGFLIALNCEMKPDKKFPIFGDKVCAGFAAHFGIPKQAVLDFIRPEDSKGICANDARSIAESLKK
jgi:hypothetical protein